MTNLEKFYPGRKLKDFKADGWSYVKHPDSSKDNPYTIPCSACPARDYCDTDRDHKTCIDTFEVWAKMEAV